MTIFVQFPAKDSNKNTCIKDSNKNICVKDSNKNTCIKDSNKNTCVKDSNKNTCIKDSNKNTCVKDSNKNTCVKDSNKYICKFASSWPIALAINSINLGNCFSYLQLAVSHSQAILFTLSYCLLIFVRLYIAQSGFFSKFEQWVSIV
jgi:hypothetical protein